jgi:hypothetical protein
MDCLPTLWEKSVDEVVRAKVVLAVVCSHRFVLLLSTSKTSFGMFVNLAQFIGHQLTAGMMTDMLRN